MPKQGFNPDYYDASPELKGQGAVVNNAVEALSDGFQIGEDSDELIKAGGAIATAIMQNHETKTDVIITITKLVMMNLFDELKEREQEVAELKKRVLELEAST